MAAPDRDRLSLAEVKEQILANCATLWPIFHPSSNKDEDDRPKLTINTIGGSATVFAHVVYETEHGLYIMMQGPDASSQRQACEKLLATTSEILANLRKNNFHYESHLRMKKAGNSGGTYFAQ